MTATLTTANGESVSIENPEKLVFDVAPEGEQIPEFTIELTGGTLTVSGCLSMLGYDNLWFARRSGELTTATFSVIGDISFPSAITLNPDLPR